MNDNYCQLFNVIDVRTGLHHSVAIVKARNARFYVPVMQEETDFNG